MGKISNYASALKAKLTDYFVIASNNNGVLETKKVTTEQIGDAVASDQVHSSLNTSDKTLIGGINEVNSNVGTLSSLTTTDKSSLVGAVNSLVLAVETYSTRFSLNDNSFASVDFTITKSGYTPIVVGTISSSGYTEICTYYFRNNNNGCRVNLGNHTGSNIIGGTLTITVIYAKS